MKGEANIEAQFAVTVEKQKTRANKGVTFPQFSTRPQDVTIVQRGSIQMNF